MRKACGIPKGRLLVKSHLNDIQRAIIEGEHRPAFLEFLRKIGSNRGLYALYDKRGKLHYVGKASDLPTRLNQHLTDRHAESWDRMSLFFLSEVANISEIEGLLVATTKPKGNKQKPHIGKDLRAELRKYLRNDAIVQIEETIYPKKNQPSDKLFERITAKRLKGVNQGVLADVLNITQARVSQLINEDKKEYSVLRQYIREGGHRDKILLMLEKQKR